MSISRTLTWAVDKGHLTAPFSMGETYTSLTMLDGSAKPTEAQIAAWESDRIAEKASVAYIDVRKKAYRDGVLALKNYKGDYIDSMGFVLDALIGEVVAIRAGAARPAEFTALLQMIAAVKAANPKP